MVKYAHNANVGLDSIYSLHDGCSITIKWNQAYPDNQNNKIAYHIYYSTEQSTILSEGVKFVSVSGDLETTLSIFDPGQLYYFLVRPVEYSASDFDLENDLPDYDDNLKYYPESVLRSDITAVSTIIPLLDVSDFPNSGIIKIGAEFIQYLSKDNMSNDLHLSDVSQRGFNNSNARLHTTDGYDGYKTWSTAVRLLSVGESSEYDRVYMVESEFDYDNFPYTEDDGYKQITKDVLHSDLNYSDEDVEDFVPFDYAGWHRVDPVKLLQGDCTGSYMMGEKGCIDAHGNYSRVRGRSLQDISNERLEVLLRLSGRAAVLLRRQRTGIVCSCVGNRRERMDDRCPHCFAPGTLINTENGYLPIESINIGDKVLSVDGYYYPVLKVFKNKFVGKLKSILTSTTTNPILTTPDHPFLILDTNDHSTLKGNCGPKCDNFIKNGDGQNNLLDIRQLPSGKFHARAKVKNHKRKVLGSFNSYNEASNAILEYKDLHSNPAHRLEWQPSKNINKNSWLVSKYNKKYIDLEYYKIPPLFQKNTKLGELRQGETTFKVDNEFLWIIGIYLAEGSCNKRSVQFSLHKNETGFQNRIFNFFKKYKYNPKIKPVKSSNCTNVLIHSTTLAQWFPKFCGHLCYNKKIPQEFMFLPNDKLWSIFCGIYDGDGVKRENEIIQTSEILCLQMFELLQRCGKTPLITKIKNNRLTKLGNKRKDAYRINWESNNNVRKNRKGRWKFYEQDLNKVKEVSEIDYDGYVYNLEVSGDHTYIVQNIAVHNCHGTGKVVGYQQYFSPRRSDGRIMIRLSPGEEALKQYEAGLESEFGGQNQEMWTLVTPILYPRDVIILYDNNDNEDFRYEVLNVVRNNLLGEDMGAQKFNVARVRKTDPIYQVRVFANTEMFPETINTTIASAANGNIPPHTHSIKINENITSISQINQNTSVNQGHSHTVINGIIQNNGLGHTHDIILP